jgi:hypothetical protein
LFPGCDLVHYHQLVSNTGANFISFSQVQGHGHASEAVAMAKIRGDMKRMVVRAWLGWAIGKDLLGLKGKESI